MRNLLDDTTALLNDVHKANGMNKTLSHQYEQLRKRIENFKKGQKILRPNSVRKHQNEIIEELTKELEKVLLLCSVVWYGMMWYGMVWYDVVWYGVVWYGMVWCGMV